MKENNTSLSLAELTLLAFIILKLCNVIDWSWWWILSPLWIEFAIIILVVILRKR